MSVENPMTLKEWSLYTKKYEGVTLRSKALNVNTMLFVEELRSEGKELDYIKNIIILFARRMSELGMHPPQNGVYSYDFLMKTDPLCRTLWGQVKNRDVFLGEEEDFYEDIRTEPDELDLELGINPDNP